MKVVLALLLLLVAPIHAAEPVAVAQFGQVTITLTGAPCDVPGVKDKVIDTGYTFQNGSAEFPPPVGHVKLCWAMMKDSAEVFVLDTTGDYGTLPLAAFKLKGI